MAMTEKKVLEVIKHMASDRRRTKLILSNEGLTSLPREIGMLTRLTTLDVSRNQLTSLPPEIGNLTGSNI